MKQAMNSFIAAALAWLLFALHGAGAELPRIAVYGDSSLADLVDVTTTVLAGQAELTVLDRADVEKLGRENELQAALHSQDFSPLQLLPADGLVFLRAVTADGKTGVFARLVAVRPGVVLREVALPDGADPMAQAQALELAFAPYWPKLAALQKGKTEAISLLGLRFEVDSAQSREMERSMNVLLSSRLSAEPDVMVLERWRLDDAAFEKELMSRQPASFWAGSSLVDGSMRLQDDGLVHATLRLRPPQGAEVSYQDQERPDNLAALAGRLADKIRNRPLPPDSWNPANEAAHYAELGRWCLDNRLFDEGAQAIESALALGDTSRATHTLEVKSWAMLAYPDDLRVLNTLYNPLTLPITPESLPARLAAVARAASLGRDYLVANKNFSSKTWMLEDPADLTVPLLNNCLRVLRFAYANNYQRNHAEAMTDARHEVQKLIAQMAESLQDITTPQYSYFLIYRIRYAAMWNETPEATVAFYRGVLAGPGDGVKVREEMFSFGTAAPYLDSEDGPPPTGMAAMKSPWIVAWDGRSPDDLKATWKKFVDDLAASPDVIAQADALKFEFHTNRMTETQHEILTRLVDFLIQHQDVLSGPQGRELAAGLSACMNSLGNGAQPARIALLDLYTKLFQARAPLSSVWVYDMSTAVTASMSLPTAQNLLAALNDYARWYATQKVQDSQMIEALARGRQTIYRMKTELVPPPSTADAFSVTEMWEAKDEQSGGGPDELPFIDASTLIVAEGKLWFMTKSYPHQVYCMDPESLATVAVYDIPVQFDPAQTNFAAHHLYVAVTPQYLVVTLSGQVLLCSRADQHWQALDLPPSTYRPRWVNNTLYLLYDVQFGDRTNDLNVYGKAIAGSGLIHLAALPDGPVDYLISSRRIPPQNALDGHPLGTPFDVWMTRAGLTLALSGGTPLFRIYATPPGKNDWAPLVTNTKTCHVKVTPVGALVEHWATLYTFQKLALMGEAGTRLLLANPDEPDAIETAPPVWNFPDDLRTSPIGMRSQISPVMRGADLCLCRSSLGDVGDGEDTCLYYFTAGRRDGLKIPLSFDVSHFTNAYRAKLASHPILDYIDLTATDQGLVICGPMMQGFWAIPWNDIDAYRARHSSTTAAATHPGP